MNVYIVGLGLIGASYAAGLKAAGHHVDGYDHDPDTLKKALQDTLIATGSLEAIGDADILIMALYPKAIVPFLRTHHHRLAPNTLVTDVAGVKKPLEDALLSAPLSHLRYLSHHPMAGKATRGYDAHDAQLFVKANCLIIHTPLATLADTQLLQTLLEDLHFAQIITVDALRHDEIIAFTSQLTHAIAVALMHADHDPLTPLATGDSFRDLTRIADINAPMWAELFLLNKAALVAQIERFSSTLNNLKVLIEQDDSTELERTLEAAALKRQAFKMSP